MVSHLRTETATSCIVWYLRMPPLDGFGTLCKPLGLDPSGTGSSSDVYAGESTENPRSIEVSTGTDICTSARGHGTRDIIPSVRNCNINSKLR